MDDRFYRYYRPQRSSKVELFHLLTYVPAVMVKSPLKSSQGLRLGAQQQDGTPTTTNQNAPVRGGPV